MIGCMVKKKKCVDELECAFLLKYYLKTKGSDIDYLATFFEKVISALKAFYFTLILKLFKTVARFKMRSVKM